MYELNPIYEHLENGGAYVATTETGMELRMWHAGEGHYIVALKPQDGQPASTSAYGLENIMATMGQWAPLSQWTKEADSG